MKTSRFVTFAVTSALLGMGLVHRYLERLEAEVRGGELLPVLVVTETLAQGATLERKLLGVREVPAAYVGERSVPAGDVDRVLGARSSSRIEGGDFLLWSDLDTDDGKLLDLSNRVPEGMRAFALGPENPYDGLLLPGDRVDVLFTTDARGGLAATRTLLQNLLVLSVAGSTTRGGEGQSKGLRARITTLSVSLEQSQVLAQAKLEGRLELVLRNAGDTVVQENLPTTSNEDLDSETPVGVRGPNPGDAQEATVRVP